MLSYLIYLQKNYSSEINEIYTACSPDINLSNETKHITIQQLEQPAEIFKRAQCLNSRAHKLCSYILFNYNKTVHFKFMKFSPNVAQILG